MNWTLLPGSERVHVYHIARTLLLHQPRPIAPASISLAVLPLHTFPSQPRSFSTSGHGAAPWKITAYRNPLSRLPLLQSSLSQVVLQRSVWNTSLWTGRRLFSPKQIPATSWLQTFYSRARRKDAVSVRCLSTTRRAAREVKEDEISKTAPGALGDAPRQPSAEKASTEIEDANEKRLFDRLPDITQRFHRPTKEELLAAATGFWSRLSVRFKWLTIRSSRPFNSDDLSAFFSWIIVGHVIWILVGTTTFFSLLIFTVNTVFAQGLSFSGGPVLNDSMLIRNAQKHLLAGSVII